jgi:hypothetical protein
MMPFYLFNQAGTCLGDASERPDQHDLDSRAEHCLFDERFFPPNQVRSEHNELVLLPEPQLTDTQLLAQRDLLLSAAALRIAPLQDAKELGLATDDELARLTAEQHYRVALMRLTEQPGWPDNIVWPELP